MRRFQMTVGRIAGLVALALLTGCPAQTLPPLARQQLEETVVQADYASAYEGARTVLLNYAYGLDTSDYSSGTMLFSREYRPKDPTKAGLYAVFPGGGAFYTGAYGLGVVNAVLWPWSIAWDAPSAIGRAKAKRETDHVTVTLRTVRDGVAVRFSRRPERSPEEDTRFNQELVTALRSQLLLGDATSPVASGGGDLGVRMASPGGDAPAPPPGAVAAGTRYAVVIGVSRYRAKGLALKHARADAEAVYAFLTGPAGGVSKEHARLLVDDQATLRNVKAALGEFLAKSAKPQDTVVVYYAGHGAPEADLSGWADDGVEKYLVPVDADPAALFTTGLSMTELDRILRRIEARRLVVFLDSCFSGAASPGNRTFASAGGSRRVAVTSEFLRRLARGSGRVVITASAPNEVSLESDVSGHGLFTQFLLSGLRGDAARPDGTITVLSLYQYLDAQLPVAARASGMSQHPAMIGRVDEDIVLVEGPHAAAQAAAPATP
jgi:caspase domain-containing protein